MMRKIKFRGIRKNNEEWVYGSYIDFDLLHQIIPTGKTKAVVVIPETVSQYTGLKDKNGIEIYEGDIVDDRNFKCEVIYTTSQEGWCGFIRDNERIKTPASGMYSNTWKGCFEVVGNIHQNPDLLNEEN